MTFREITRKNLKYNIRKFASYFLVNAFVVCTLFLFGSLLFNDTINNDPVMQGLRTVVIVGALTIAVFAVIFLIYTGFYFIRSRGRELGVYLTLGMTHKDLVRMAALESVIIFAGATVLGIGTGLLLGGLFFLIVGRILDIPGNLFELNIRIFLFCLGTLAATFLVQLAMVSLFIRRLSIVNITKAAKTKDAVRQNPVIGIISLVLLVLSTLIFMAMLLPDGRVANALRQSAFWEVYTSYTPVSEGITVVILFVSLYFVVGSGINVVRAVCKLFPRLYQRHILLFAGLSHKFRAYRTVLYSISILTGFAVIYMGWTLAVYIATTDDVAHATPFHFTIEQRAGMNQISGYELRQLVESTGAEIESIRILPYMDSRSFEVHGRGRFAYGILWECLRTSYFVSDKHFSSFTGLEEPLRLAVYELVVAHSGTRFTQVTDPYGHIKIAIEPLSEKLGPAYSPIEWRWGVLAGWLQSEEIPWATRAPALLNFAPGNFSYILMPVANNPIRPGSVGAFVQNSAHIVAHELWLELAETGEVNHLIGFNLASGDHASVMDALVAELSARNNLQPKIWATHFPEAFSRLRPLSQYESYRIALQANGFMLFIFGFLGIIGLVSVFMVLYHKFAADVDDESENIVMFRKIGLTVRECRKYIQAHLGIVFFFPLFFGGIAALLLLYVMFASLQEIDTWQYFRYVLVMYGGIILLNTGLYMALRKRFFRILTNL